MTNIFLAVLEISIPISLVIAVLILFSPLINRRYAAKWKSWIWVLIALRLIIPFSGADVKSMVDSWFRSDSQFTMKSWESDTDSLPEHAMPQGRIMIEIPAQMTTPISTPSERSELNITLLDLSRIPI